MNGFTELKDIRFRDTKANILLRGGMISRENLMNVKDSMITMLDVHFGIAKRINDVTSLEVRYLDEWRYVMCGDTATLQSIYASATSEEEIDSHEEHVVVETADEEAPEEVNSREENIVVETVPEEEYEGVEESVEETESHEDEVAEEEAHEEAEVVETTFDNDQDDGYDADEITEESSAEDASKTNEVFVTGMTVGDSIEGYGTGTITGVTTTASDSTDTAEVTTENAFDASNAEPATTSTSTASTTINSQGNARRQVNINAHGKHRRH